MSDENPIPPADDPAVETLREESTEQVPCPLCGKVFEIFVVQEFTPILLDENGGWGFKTDRTADMTEVKKHLNDHMTGGAPVNRKERRKKGKK